MQRKERRKIKQIYFRIAFILILILAIVYLFKGVNAKYNYSATSNAEVDIAFYIFKEQSISQNLKLPSILPSSSNYVYTFSVANNYNNERTQTALEYTIKMKTTTNLPLRFHVHKQGSATELITSNVVERDSDRTFFRYITIQGDEFGYTQNQQNIYELEIEFSDANDDVKYEGIIEFIQLTVESRQKVDNSNTNNISNNTVYNNT